MSPLNVFRLFKGFAFAATLLASPLLLGISSTQAQDITVQHRFIEKQIDGDVVTGLLQMIVWNGSDSELSNVDMRSGSAGLIVLGNGLLQLGEVPPGEARIGSGFVVLDTLLSTKSALNWRLDYDHFSEGHRTVEILSVPIEQGE